MRGANRGSPLIGLFRTESTAARYDGAWPAPMPFRLVLDTADGEPRAEISDGVVRIALSPGTRLDLRLSSSLRREDLDLLALWNLFPEPFRDGAGAPTRGRWAALIAYAVRDDHAGPRRSPTGAGTRDCAFDASLATRHHPLRF